MTSEDSSSSFFLAICELSLSEADCPGHGFHLQDDLQGSYDRSRRPSSQNEELSGLLLLDLLSGFLPR